MIRLLLMGSRSFLGEFEMNPQPIPDDQQSGIFGAIFEWMTHPFQTQGSALNWVLFVGLLVVAAWFWQHTLLAILDEV